MAAIGLVKNHQLPSETARKRRMMKLTNSISSKDHLYEVWGKRDHLRR